MATSALSSKCAFYSGNVTGCCITLLYHTCMHACSIRQTANCDCCNGAMTRRSECILVHVIIHPHECLRVYIYIYMMMYAHLSDDPLAPLKSASPPGASSKAECPQDDRIPPLKDLGISNAPTHQTFYYYYLSWIFSSPDMAFKCKRVESLLCDLPFSCDPSINHHSDALVDSSTLGGGILYNLVQIQKHTNRLCTLRVK